jgi:hypothetical protein
LTSLATSRFVHLGCLRYWIRGRLNLTDGATGGGPEVHGIGWYLRMELEWDVCGFGWLVFVDFNGTLGDIYAF